MKTLSPPDRPLMMVNPYAPHSMADARAVIYAGAFCNPFYDGLLTEADLTEAVTGMLSRPNLTHLNGRPC